MPKESEEEMKIILTVGHSILKTGNCTSADGRSFGGVLEYAYNKHIVEQVANYLSGVGHKVDVLVCPELRFVKSSDEKSYKLQKVNSGNYDLVVELHLNASKLHNARGCEVLYKSSSGKKFAQQVQSRLAMVFPDRGIQKRDNLYMLNGTKPVAIMLETFFCDNSIDCELAEKHDVSLLIAEGIHGSSIVYTPSKPIVSGVLYRVQIGAFSVNKNAERLLTELKGKGFDAFLTMVDLGQTIYRVQVGAFGMKANAEAMKNKLKIAGYEALIVQA